MSLLNITCTRCHYLYPERTDILASVGWTRCPQCSEKFTPTNPRQAEYQRVQRNLLEMALNHKLSAVEYLSATRYWDSVFAGIDPEE